MGVIKLDDFNPEDVGTTNLAVEKAVMVVRFTTCQRAQGHPLSHAYVRPMGVLNDASATLPVKYSLVPSRHGAGTSLERTNRLVVGGAAILKLDPTFIDASPKDFQKFPFSQQLTSGSTTYTNTLSVGVTQTIRSGRYKGQGIEDVGITVDTVFRPRWSDLQPDSTTNTQYDRIAASLARTGQKNGQIEAAGIHEFIVFQADGKTVIAKKRSRATTKQKFAISVSAAASALGNSHITIIGKTAGKQVLKTIRNVKVIPDDDKYMKINIGLDVALDTEPDCDFLYLSVKGSDGIEDFLTRSKSLDGTKTFNGISGRKKIVKGTIPFTTKSERFSVSLKFTSDWDMEFTGATINSFTVSAA
ncbi:hypothetical protein BASA83_007510 [Batrachochytrium salamandrivorans]|nr:hypothetical protein BASA83_007510 [Batrachochytrium salamandrivorans]